MGSTNDTEQRRADIADRFFRNDPEDADPAALDYDKLLAHFCVLSGPEALASALKTSPCPDIVLRIAADGTTRGVRGKDRRVDMAGKWFVQNLQCWMASENVPQEKWPHIPHLPVHTFLTPTAKKMSTEHAHLAPKERDSLLVTDTILSYLRELPKGTRAWVVFSGDGAESSMLMNSMICLRERVPRELPHIEYIPMYHLCDQHGATLVAKQAIEVYTALAGLDRKKFERKFYLQCAQVKIDIARIAAELALQLEETTIEAIPDELIDTEKRDRWHQFIADMRQDGAALINK
jgi:hypothetical protein